MRKLILLAILLALTIWSQAQDTCNIYLRDTLIYKAVIKGDTAYWYDIKTMDLESITYDKSNSNPDRWVFESWTVEDGVRESLFRYDFIKGLALDGICHGTTSTGARCTRKTTKLFCWQHD